MSVDEACEQFEADWRAGQATPIESYMDRAAADERMKLLRALLVRELELRRSRGERPAREEYHARSPAAAEVIVAAFAATETTQTRLSDRPRVDEEDRDEESEGIHRLHGHLDRSAVPVERPTLCMLEHRHDGNSAPGSGRAPQSPR
jgi:hypothetical protein